MALRLMREWMKYLKWILWFVVITFIAALFFDFGSINQFGRASSGKVAVSVGKEEITYDEFRRQYQSLESRYREMFRDQYNAELAKQFNLPQQALDQLINRRILLLEAGRIGLRATDEEVKQEILDYEVFKGPDGKFVGRERVKEILRQNRMSEQEFADAVREDVLLKKLNDVLSQTSYLSDADLETAWREQNEKAKVRYLALPSTSVTAPAPDDAEIQAYFTENSGKYRLAEQRVVDYVLVDTAKLRTDLKIDDAELRTYYDQNRKDYERPEQIKARHILLRVKPDRDDAATLAAARAALARIQGGEDFGAVAREISDDEGTKPRGGDLGFFARGQMVKPFDEAAWNAQVGALVGPVKTDFGYHLIQVQDKQAGGVQPFEQVSAGIRARLTSERVPQVAEARAKEAARKIADQKIKTAEELKAFAQKEGLTFETTPAFGRDDNPTGVGRSADFNTAAFEKLSGDKISDPIKIGRGWAILRLQKVNPPRMQELNEVRAKVRDEVMAKKQRAAAKAKLDGVRAQIAAGQKDLATAAKELGVEVKESESLTRTANIENVGSAQKVVDAALELPVGALSQAVETANGAMLFEVMERNRFEKSTFESQKSTIRKQEEDKRLSQLTTSLIEQRRRDLAPQVDAQLVEEFNLSSNPAGRRG